MHHRCQRHRRQILPPVSLVLLIPVANLSPVSTTPAANLPPVSTTPVAICHRYQLHRRQICHRCQWHRWQIMGTISGCWDLKVNLKAKCIYRLTILPKGVQTKKFKLLWLKVFCICHRCQRHRWQTLSCEYLRKFSKKFETTPMIYSGAWGKLIREKNQKSKILWHCPFNHVLFLQLFRLWSTTIIFFVSFFCFRFWTRITFSGSTRLSSSSSSSSSSSYSS